MSLPARIGSPKGITGLIDEISNPAYAGAVGLLLYGSQEEGFEQQSSWSPGGLMSKFPTSLPGKGLVDRAGDLFKKLLP